MHLLSTSRTYVESSTLEIKGLLARKSLCLVVVQPRKTGKSTDMTEKLLTWDVNYQHKQTNMYMYVDDDEILSFHNFIKII